MPGCYKSLPRLVLTPSCLGGFDKFIRRQRCLVEHIYFVIELGTYTCSACARHETSNAGDNDITARAITELFLILNTWSTHGDNLQEGLALEFSIYSPSDSRQAFKGDLHLNIYSFANEDFGGDTSLGYDLCHGWYQGRRTSPPPMEDIQAP